MNRETFFANLVDNHRPKELWETIPKGTRDYAYKRFELELMDLYYPYIIILPITQEGEIEREYLYGYHHDENGDLIHSSIGRYGAYEHNFDYNGETYLAIIVNQD